MEGERGPGRGNIEPSKVIAFEHLYMAASVPLNKIEKLLYDYEQKNAHIFYMIFQSSTCLASFYFGAVLCTAVKINMYHSAGWKRDSLQSIRWGYRS